MSSAGSRRGSRVRHLTRRFIGALKRREPTAKELDWVRQCLSGPEFELFTKMNPNDQAHGVEVARAVVASRPSTGADDPTWLLPAAFLHDVGKVDSRANVAERVVATVMEPWAPDSLVTKLASGPGPIGRVGRHLRYPAMGASMLSLAGSHEDVRAWAAQHHANSRDWTLAPHLACRLREADDASS